MERKVNFKSPNFYFLMYKYFLLGYKYDRVLIEEKIYMFSIFLSVHFCSMHSCRCKPNCYSN